MGRSSGMAPSKSTSRPMSYLQQSELPFPSLIFLLPLIVVYELGTRHYAAQISDIKAFSLLQDFFYWCGATGRYLPALAVVGILLSCHIARNDPWRFQPGTLAGMALESLALGAPLLLLARVIAQYVPLSTAGESPHGLVVLSLGAGIYEELVFRLMCFTLLGMVFLDLAKLKKAHAVLLVVPISAILFSLYHYLGNEPFSWRSFTFRTGAGVYFGIIFMLRGFGITAGSHAAYDVIISLS